VPLSANKNRRTVVLEENNSLAFDDVVAIQIGFQVYQAYLDRYHRQRQSDGCANVALNLAVEAHCPYGSQ